MAAVKLLLDGQLRESVGATDLPQITEQRRQELGSLPVVLSARQDIWHYIGFKHVNGSQPWQSYAKAQYIAWVHNDLGQPLDEIAQRIGDRHSTVKRLYRGLMVLRQAERSGRFDLDDAVEEALFIPITLYTGLDYQEHSGVAWNRQRVQLPPRPRAARAESRRLEISAYGSNGRKSTDTRPLVQSQNQIFAA